MEESSLLTKLEERENYYHIDNDEILNTPIWRIVRYQSRLYYVQKHTNYVATTGGETVAGKRKVKCHSGFWKYLGKKKLNIFYTFNRLVFCNGCYFDKFIDPVIEESKLRDENYVIVDSPNYAGDYPRIHKNHVVDNEVRTISKQILKKLMIWLVPFILSKKIKLFFKKAQSVYELPDNFIKQYHRMIALFIAEYLYDFFWFSLLQPKRVMVVFREGYFAQIAVCKRLAIPIAEFQHGITLDKTVSFTGDYDYRIDPDYFLTFGSYWKSEHFGMTNDRTICIGWAYSQYMKHRMDIRKKEEGAILVISSPEISDKVLEAIRSLIEWNPSMKFHIRLHPSERFNDAQKSKLHDIPQAEVVDNSVDSAAVLPQYQYVIGENSSVLYEALSLGCKVGLLNICGLQPPIDKPGIKGSFDVINSKESFEAFISMDRNKKLNTESFYSEFDDRLFENFINNKM